jgi:CRP-like cAMP-binding protein
MVSLIAENSQGGSVEIGVIGNEGILAMELLTGVQRATCRSIVQIPGQALKISGEALKRHSERHTIFHLQLLRFWQVLHKQLSQSVVCNRFHTFEQRLCRWLLMSSAHAKSNDFPFTQEFISFMLGANRTTANAALGELKKSGLIYCKRGLIRILDRKRMEEAACECYQTNMNDLEELYRFQTCRKPRNKNSFLSL